MRASSNDLELSHDLGSKGSGTPLARTQHQLSLHSRLVESTTHLLITVKHSCILGKPVLTVSYHEDE
jgi:hypothetical protein